MQLSREAITDFQKLYQDKCGVWLSDEEAQIKALEDLKRFSLIYKPIPTTNIDFYNKLNDEINSK